MIFYLLVFIVLIIEPSYQQKNEQKLGQPNKIYQQQQQQQEQQQQQQQQQQQLLTSSFERSDLIQNGFNSERCQKYFSKTAFLTIEDVIACGKNEDNEAECNKNDYTYWLPTPEGEERKWTCKTEEPPYNRQCQIIKELKIIYITLTKCGSSTTRTFLDNIFNSKEHEDMAKIEDIPVDELKDYFIFTFVRDPLQRIESGLGQIRKQGVPYSHEEALRKLDQGCVVDKHLWSIARYLRVLDGAGNQIKYDFIGSVENIDEDFKYLLPLLKMDPLQRKKVVEEGKWNEFTSHQKVPHSNRGRRNVHSSLNYNDPDIRRIMCRLVEHDYECLSGLYALPDICKK